LSYGRDCCDHNLQDARISAVQKANPFHEPAILRSRTT